MYKITARQILVIALISGLFAAATVALVVRLSNRLEPAGSAFTENSPVGITDPGMATDEQNNIEIYRTLSPGVVNIHSTSYARDFFGFVEPLAPDLFSIKQATFLLTTMWSSELKSFRLASADRKTTLPPLSAAILILTWP